MSDDIDRPPIPDCFVSARIRDVSGVSVSESLESFTFYRSEFSPYIYVIILTYDFIIVWKIVRCYRRRFLCVDISIILSSRDLVDSQHELSLMLLQKVTRTCSCVCRCDWIWFLWYKNLYSFSLIRRECWRLCINIMYIPIHSFSAWMDIRQAHGSLRYFFEKRIREVFLIERLPSFIVHRYILEDVSEEYILVLWLCHSWDICPVESLSVLSWYEGWVDHMYLSIWIDLH